MLDTNSFNVKLEIFDSVYYSFITITTVGYGEINPTSIYARLTVIFEVIIGVWFLITILPVAVADQSERIKNFREKQYEFRKGLAEEFKKGNVKQADENTNKS